MAHRKIFPSVLSQHVRTGILGRLRNIKHLIPSLHTFLEDTKYIEPCVQIMKNILPKTHQGTVLEGFTKLHNGQETFHEQTTEAHIQATHEPANIAHWKSYRQLWLFAFRHFPEMTGSPPRKDIGKPRPSRPCIEHTWWHKIASLAQTFGYRNISTLFPQSEDADTRMTQQFLHHIRPTQYYQFDEGVFDAEVLRICSVLSKVQARQVEIERPYIASDRDASCGHDISFRCGRPFENAFIADRPFMFIRHIYSKHISLETRRFLSTFAVKRSIFHSFFGEPELCPGQLHSLEEEAPEDLQILSSDRLSSPVSPISWMKKGSTSTLEVQSHTTRAQGNVNESHDQSPDRLHETAPPVGTYIGQDRSASTGLVILRPLSPVHQGLFETDYVQWDQPSLLRSSLNIDSKKYIFLEPDRAKRLKSVPIADVIHPRNSPYSLIIQAHEGKVAEIRAKYENLSTRTIQAIYSGSIKKIS